MLGLSHAELCSLTAFCWRRRRARAQLQSIQIRVGVGGRQRDRRILTDAIHRRYTAAIQQRQYAG